MLIIIMGMLLTSTHQHSPAGSLAENELSPYGIRLLTSTLQQAPVCCTCGGARMICIARAGSALVHNRTLLVSAGE